MPAAPSAPTVPAVPEAEAKAEDGGAGVLKVETRRDRFNEEEEDFYEALYTESRTRFVSYVQEGTLLNNYAHIFELLMRMRQAANHPFLVTHRSSSSGGSGTAAPGDKVHTACARRAPG
jgi:DNA repair protein RAD16